MAISFISSATGTNTATLGTHAAGDLILVFAYRDGSTLAPTLASGFTNIQGSGSNTNSARMGWKIAASGSESVGTWTNATSVIAAVYRGTDDVGVSAIQGAASTTVTWGASTLQVTDGSSWFVCAAGHRSTNTALENPPTGTVNRANVQDATDEASLHDTDGGVSSWSSQSVAVGGTGSGWRSIRVELLASTVPALTGQTVSTTIDSGTPSVVTNKADGTVYVVVVPNGDTPSVAQIKAGQQSSGAAAINAQNQTVTVSGLQTFSAATGLTPLTNYDAWFVHTNSVGDSVAVKADFFTQYVLVGRFSAFSSVSDGGRYGWTNPNNAVSSNNARANCGEGLTWGAFTTGEVESTDLLRSGPVTNWPSGAPAGTITSIRVVVEGYFNSSLNSETLSGIGLFKNSTATRLSMNPAVSVAGTSDIVNDVLFSGGSLTAADLNSANFYCDVKMQGTTNNTSDSGGGVAAFVDDVYIIVECDDFIAPAAQTSSSLFWAFP